MSLTDTNSTIYIYNDHSSFSKILGIHSTQKLFDLCPLSKHGSSAKQIRMIKNNKTTEVKERKQFRIKLIKASGNGAITTGPQNTITVLEGNIFSFTITLIVADYSYKITNSILHYKLELC